MRLYYNAFCKQSHLFIYPHCFFPLAIDSNNQFLSTLSILTLSLFPYTIDFHTLSIYTHYRFSHSFYFSHHSKVPYHSPNHSRR